MFTLTGRTFISYEDHLGRATVSILTHSQGNTDEDEWFYLFANLLGSNSKVHVASFRGMIVNPSKARALILQENINNDVITVLKQYVLKSIETYEKKLCLQ